MTTNQQFKQSNTEAANCCICFTTDRGYLFPTVVSAIQARAHSSRRLADVAVYCFAAETQETKDFAEACAAEGVAFTCLDPRVIDGSPAAFARLFLDRFVPQQYRHFLYIDGDTQIMEPLDPLILAHVPPGHFLATTDPVAFKYRRTADAPRELQDYLGRLGLTAVQQYFNSGVLRINREGWSEIGREAFKISAVTNTHAFHFWDQDGLNAVGTASGSRLPMSVKYNFPIFLRNCRLESVVKPAIYHFMSAPKPWNGNFPPWNLAATLPYRDIGRKYQRLASYQRPFPLWKKARYILQQRAKQVDEAVNWGLSWRRAEVLLYEGKCGFASEGCQQVAS